MRLRRPCASSFAPEAMGERSTLVLTAYLRLWSVANILRILSGFVAGTALKDTVQAQPVHLLGVFLMFRCTLGFVWAGSVLLYLRLWW